MPTDDPDADERRVSRVFSTQVSGGADDELTFEVKRDATIEKLEVRFYPGPRLDLELRPFRETQAGRRHDLVQVEGRSDNTIVGDDDKMEFFLAEEVVDGDTIGVTYTNNDSSNSYDFWVSMELERAGGTSRSTAGILGGIF